MNKQSSAPVFVQPLETRTLLSFGHFHFPPGTGSTITTNPTILADLKQLRTDTIKLRADSREARQTIKADADAVQEELASLRESTPDLKDQLAPLRKTLRADIQAVSTG
jgi:hypothetical protein